MAKAVILTVDDDRAVSQAVTRDVRRHSGAEFQVVSATSGAEALDLLREFAVRGRRIALLVSDQRMPNMTGVEFLAQSREFAPEARLVLLTAYADTDVAIKAINDIGLDYYLMKPWDPPEERLYPVLDDQLNDWRDAHPEQDIALRVVGTRWSERTHEIKTFLARNYVQYEWLDLERDEEARTLQVAAAAGVTDLPLVLVPEREPLRAPSPLQVADALGLRTRAEQPLYDVCIVGSGPAGLAAAVYAASEGLQTVVVEREAPGGQAAQSAAIENYLGFPKGLTGADLTHRAVAQARRFGAEMVLARDVSGIDARGPVRAVRFDDATAIEARSIVVATGVSYRLLDAPGVADYTGRGVFYGSSASDARQCEGEDVYVVGAANSAGQAVLNLARYARRVVLLVRSDALEKSMSQYLVSRLLAAENVDIRLQTEVAAARGDEHLEELTLANTVSGEKDDVTTNWMFVFIGAAPRTTWLGDDVARDARGFILTGPDIQAIEHPAGARWPLARAPLSLETSVPGIFAAGDVRFDSMKRVASAVGEGAMAIYLVHRYLATT
jgi:thioredoxin reductase (NADPH)